MAVAVAVAAAAVVVLVMECAVCHAGTPTRPKRQHQHAPTKQLQGGITKIADANSTIADPEVDPMAHAAGDKPPPAFDEFAGNMFCRHGVKLANCSGVNPCVGHKCFPVRPPPPLFAVHGVPPLLLPPAA